VGGAGRCNNCGLGVRALTLGKGGLYVKCSSCGYVERVWTPSEGRERLKALLERFGVALHSLPVCLRRLIA